MDEQTRLTRERNKKIRQEAREAKAEMEKRDRVLVLETLRTILRDPNTTVEQRLYTIAVLDHMQYYGFVPYDVKFPGERTDFTETDKKLAAAIEEASKRGPDGAG